jgi:hypothetical protein
LASHSGWPYTKWHAQVQRLRVSDATASCSMLQSQVIPHATKGCLRLSRTVQPRWERARPIGPSIGPDLTRARPDSVMALRLGSHQSESVAVGCGSPGLTPLPPWRHHRGQHLLWRRRAGLWQLECLGRQLQACLLGWSATAVTVRPRRCSGPTAAGAPLQRKRDSAAERNREERRKRKKGHNHPLAASPEFKR